MARARRTSTTPAASVRRRARYHHGNLRAALIEATERLIEEGGTEHVTVRAAARRAGVSSGAPFRHFPTRTALMTAVAEQATHRLRTAVVNALAATDPTDARAGCVAFGRAYLRWATQNPIQFRVVSDRSLIDYESSPSMVGDNAVLRSLMHGVLAEGQRRGTIRAGGIAELQVAARAMVYGLARMVVDGHFAQWGIPGRKLETTMAEAFALLLDGIAPAPLADTKPRAPRRRSAR